MKPDDDLIAERDALREQLATAVKALKRLRKLSVNPYLITEELRIINAALSKLKRHKQEHKKCA